MHRREFLKSIAASSISATYTVLFPNTSFAEYACSNPYPFNGGMVRNCSVGFRIGRITAQQECDQWCWAACIEAAFKLYGYRISQRKIVEKVFGPGLPCRPSIGPQIAAAVEGYWTDSNGSSFYATTRTHTDLQFGIQDPLALQNVSRYLAENTPVIVGALGHATLLTGMSWLEDNFGQWRLTEMIVRDPWPGNLNRRRLTPQEFWGTTYISAVIV